jgi:hypothetical protein
MTIVQYKPSCSNPVSFPTRQHINNGITNAKGGMPAKFRGADGGASFAMGRNLYSNTTLANESYNLASLTEAFKNKQICTCAASCNHMSCSCKVCNARFNSDIRHNRYSGCNVGKSINVQSSDQYIQRRKNQAIGRGSVPVQTNDTGSYKLSFKTTFEMPSTNQHTSVARSALRRSRNSGNVPPPKIAARPACGR